MIIVSSTQCRFLCQGEYFAPTDLSLLNMRLEKNQLTALSIRDGIGNISSRQTKWRPLV